jgi:hypothetical protein
VWNYGKGVIKITQDMTTINFYSDILSKQRIKGLPEVEEISREELDSLVFVVEPEPNSIFGDNFDSAYKFIKDSSVLKNFKAYTMPKYAELNENMQKIIWQDWNIETEKQGVILTGVGCNEELELAFSVFRSIVPTQHYYPDSIDYIVEYLKQRDNWWLDPGTSNFLVDENGKLILADVFAGNVDFVYSNPDTPETTREKKWRETKWTW